MDAARFKEGDIVHTRGDKPLEGLVKRVSRKEGWVSVQIEGELGQRNVRPWCLTLAESVNIAVCGCTSAGKSTLLGALFGRPYFPKGANETTMSITEIVPRTGYEAGELLMVHSEQVVKGVKEIGKAIEARDTKCATEPGMPTAVLMATMQGESAEGQTKGTKSLNDLRVTFYDLPGTSSKSAEQMLALITPVLASSDLVLLVVNANQAREEESLDKLFKNVGKNVGYGTKNNCPRFVLCLTHADEVGDQADLVKNCRDYLKTAQVMPEYDYIPRGSPFLSDVGDDHSSEKKQIAFFLNSRVALNARALNAGDLDPDSSDYKIMLQSIVKDHTVKNEVKKWDIPKLEEKAKEVAQLEVENSGISLLEDYLANFVGDLVEEKKQVVLLESGCRFYFRSVLEVTQQALAAKVRFPENVLEEQLQQIREKMEATFESRSRAFKRIDITKQFTTATNEMMAIVLRDYKAVPLPEWPMPPEFTTEHAHEYLTSWSADIATVVGSIERLVEKAVSLQELVASYAPDLATQFSIITNKLKENLHPPQDKDGLESGSALRNAAGVVAAGGAVGTVAAVATPTAMIAIATSFGTAGTGAAISSLSGVAATNAALAWLGGGTIAAGGGGMAGGAALIGTVTCGIGLGVGALIVGGGLLWVRAKKQKVAKAVKEYLEARRQELRDFYEKTVALHARFLIAINVLEQQKKGEAVSWGALQTIHVIESSGLCQDQKEQKAEKSEEKKVGVTKAS